MEAGDLFFPDEFFAGAGQQVFEIGDVILRGCAVGVALVDPAEFGLEGTDGFFGPLQILDQSLQLADQVLLLAGDLLFDFDLARRGHA